MLNIFYNTAIPASMHIVKILVKHTRYDTKKFREMHEYKKVLSYNLFNSQQNKCING